MNPFKYKHILAALALSALLGGVLFVLTHKPKADVPGTSSAIITKDKIGVFGLPDDAAAADLGVGWTRIPLFWADYEQNPAKFDQQQAGLVATKTLYTVRAVNEVKTNCYIDTSQLVKYGYNLTDQQKAHPGAFASCYPKDMSQYRQFIRGLATKYKGSVQAWQIENEVYGVMPNYWSGDPESGEIDNYITLFKAASEEIKAVDPTVPVLMAGEALGVMKFDDTGNPLPLPAGTPTSKVSSYTKNLSNVEKFFTQACNSIDVADLHLYHTIPSIPQRIKWFKNVMVRTSCNKPIWTTEGSGPNPQDPEYVNLYTTETQIATAAAKDLPERIKTQFAAGEEKVFYLPYKESSVDPIQEHLGLLDEQGAKKPAYYALKQLTKEVSSSNAAIKTELPIPPTNLNVRQLTSLFDLQSRWKVRLFWDWDYAGFDFTRLNTLPNSEIWRKGPNDRDFIFVDRVLNTFTYVDRSVLTRGNVYVYKIRSFLVNPDGTYSYSNFSDIGSVTIRK